MSEKPFHRRQIAWPVRCAIGIATDAVVAPIVWATDKLGRGDAFFRAMRKPEAKRLAKCRPFGVYELSARDVVVMAYVKSGTNWTLQIVQQLLHHGAAEFEHIHDVVSWPDSKSHFPMRHYAIPLEDEMSWRSSPEGKRVIKTHLNWDQISVLPDGTLHFSHPRSKRCLRLKLLLPAEYGSCSVCRGLGAVVPVRRFQHVGFVGIQHRRILGKP